MARGREEEITVRRIVACFAPGAAAAPEAVARLARQMQAELVGLFIEDAELLRFAALPLAAEIGFPSAARRSVDLASVERSLRAQAAALRGALAAALDPSAHAWSFRVARASPASAIGAALAEGYAPSLLLPPGSNLHAERRVLRGRELDIAQLRALIASPHPVLILPA